MFFDSSALGLKYNRCQLGVLCKLVYNAEYNTASNLHSVTSAPMEQSFHSSIVIQNDMARRVLVRS